MTSAQDRDVRVTDPEGAAPPKADERHELDAEIVRDLELDEQDEVRGGAPGATGKFVLGPGRLPRTG